MSKQIFVFVIIMLIGKNTFAQKYYKIEGTKRIFTYYGNKRSSIQINDSTTGFYYVKGGFFYISLRVGKVSKPYVKYLILNKKDKTKVTPLGRGNSAIARARFIQVSILKAESANNDSLLVEDLLNR